MPRKKTTFDEIRTTENRIKRLHTAPMNCVRQYREARHMTQSELAEASGVHRTTIARLESQGARPHRYIAEMLAKALDITIEEIYGSTVAHPYFNSGLCEPSKSGEYLCAFRRSGSHNYSYFVGYYDKSTQSWSFPPWMDFGTGELPPIMIKMWTKIPPVSELTM